MPHLHGRHNGRAAIVDVAVIGASQYRAHKQSEQPALRGIRAFKGLIDTGATTSMISPTVVQAAGLDAVNRIAYRSVDGPTLKIGYLFHVAFFTGIIMLDDPGSDQSTPAEQLQVCTSVVNGGEISLGASFDVLIGMDVITTGALTVSSDGTFSFAF